MTNRAKKDFWRRTKRKTEKFWFLYALGTDRSIFYYAHVALSCLVLLPFLTSSACLVSLPSRMRSFGHNQTAVTQGKRRAIPDFLRRLP